MYFKVYKSMKDQLLWKMWYKEEWKQRVALWLDGDMEPMLDVVIVVLVPFFILATFKVLLSHAMQIWILGLYNAYWVCW